MELLLAAFLCLWKLLSHFVLLPLGNTSRVDSGWIKNNSRVLDDRRADLWDDEAQEIRENTFWTF